MRITKTVSRWAYHVSALPGSIHPAGMWLQRGARASQGPHVCCLTGRDMPWQSEACLVTRQRRAPVGMATGIHRYPNTARRSHSAQCRTLCRSSTTCACCRRSSSWTLTRGRRCMSGTAASMPTASWRRWCHSWTSRRATPLRARSSVRASSSLRSRTAMLPQLPLAPLVWPECPTRTRNSTRCAAAQCAQRAYRAAHAHALLAASWTATPPSGS
jgi:hypothetical protein